jgi:hypothetical protein
VGDVADLAGLNREATEWASAVGLPVKVGEYLIERSLDLGRWYRQASEAERSAWRVQEKYGLEERFGQEGAKLYLDMAAQALARISHPVLA